MTAKKKADDTTELDALEQQLEACKTQLEGATRPTVGAADGDAVEAQPAGIDPASVITIVTAVIELIKFLRNRKK